MRRPLYNKKRQSASEGVKKSSFISSGAHEGEGIVTSKKKNMNHKETCPVNKENPPLNSIQTGLDTIFCTCDLHKITNEDRESFLGKEYTERERFCFDAGMTRACEKWIWGGAMLKRK